MTPAAIRDFRLRFSLSVDKLARLFKTTARSVRRWEDGSREVPGPAEVLCHVIVNSREARSLLQLEPFEPHTPGGFEG